MDIYTSKMAIMDKNAKRFNYLFNLKTQNSLSSQYVIIDDEACLHMLPKISPRHLEASSPSTLPT